MDGDRATTGTRRRRGDRRHAYTGGAPFAACIPSPKMSSAIAMPRGTPPTFWLRSDGVAAVDRERIEDPVHAEIDPAAAVLLDHLPQAAVSKLRTCRGRMVPLLSALTPFNSSDTNERPAKSASSLLLPLGTS